MFRITNISLFYLMETFIGWKVSKVFKVSDEVTEKGDEGLNWRDEL